jgi:hypothetical protein
LSIVVGPATKCLDDDAVLVMPKAGLCGVHTQSKHKLTLENYYDCNYYCRTVSAHTIDVRRGWEIHLIEVFMVWREINIKPLFK